jgi:hypothetical protein
MSERLHPAVPGWRQQDAIYEVTEEIQDESRHDAPEDYTTNVDLSHTTSVLIFLKWKPLKANMLTRLWGQSPGELRKYTQQVVEGQEYSFEELGGRKLLARGE